MSGTSTQVHKSQTRDGAIGRQFQTFSIAFVCAVYDLHLKKTLWFCGKTGISWGEMVLKLRP
jgi:hypothetical protein